MVKRHMPILILAGMTVLAVLSGACTRSASTPPPGAELPEVTSEPMSAQQATMEAVRSALLTQTSQAGPGDTQGQEPGPQDTAITAVAPENAEAPPTATQPAPTQPPYIFYTVQAGDWIYSIAVDFGIDPEPIISLNNLTAPYAVYEGDVLKIPTTAGPPAATVTPSAGGTRYTVKAGEWVYSIARKFGVDPNAIIQVNNLRPPYTLHPGQVLIIP